MKTAKDTFYSNQLREHRMPFGTRILPQGGVLFRLWAPSAEKVELCIETGAGDRQIHPMLSTGNGWYQNTISTAAPGQNYSYRIGSDLLVPDPVSRSQLDDIHGPSLIIDPNSFIWQDSDWRGRPWEEAIIYEIHTGTFSAAGNFNGIRERLPYLAELGITAIELMPIADFPGKFNWGYDGALLFAPDRSYGSCRELKELVQDAHKYGLMVILDVVYNHFGPEGNYLYVYAKEAFFTPEHHTPWGDAIRYDGTASRTVRDFFIHNALYWLEEYHFDGLRLDAVHAIYDGSNPNILEEIATAVRGGPGRDRHIHLHT